MLVPSRTAKLLAVFFSNDQNNSDGVHPYDFFVLATATIGGNEWRSLELCKRGFLL